MGVESKLEESPRTVADLSLIEASIRSAKFNLSVGE
jgi:hypothetical protein